MQKSDRKYLDYVKILEEELIPAMGCTEPIAIVYAALCAGVIAGNAQALLEVIAGVTPG